MNIHFSSSIRRIFQKSVLVVTVVRRSLLDALAEGQRVEPTLQLPIDFYSMAFRLKHLAE